MKKTYQAPASAVILFEPGQPLLNGSKTVKMDNDNGVGASSSYTKRGGNWSDQIWNNMNE